MAFYFNFGFLFSTSISQMAVPLACQMLLMDCKALSLGEPSGAGERAGAGTRGAGESGGLVAAGVCRALGGGGGAAARPAAQRRLRQAGSASQGA